MMFFRKIRVRLTSMWLYFRKRRLAKRDRGFRALMESIKESERIPRKERIRRRIKANEIAQKDKERNIEDRGITGMV